MDKNDDATQPVVVTTTQSQTQTVNLPPNITKAIEEAITIRMKNSEVLKENIMCMIEKIFREEPELLLHLYQKLTQSNEIVLRLIDKSVAKREIDLYIEDHPGCLTSEIIENLQLDPLLVGEILKELENSNKIGNESRQ